MKAKDEMLDRTVKRLEKMNGFEQEVYVDSELGTQNFKPDKTGMADFALESAGGEIVSDWTSKGLMTSYPLLKVWDIPLFYQTLSPRLAIQPQVHPGNCFGFNGAHGSIGVKLSRPIIVKAVTIEHIPRQLAPDNDISSAPRNMTLNGFDGMDFVRLANFEFGADQPSVTVQTFSFRNEKVFGKVKLDIASNWGNKDYTCVYRIRIHGDTH